MKRSIFSTLCPSIIMPVVILTLSCLMIKLIPKDVMTKMNCKPGTEGFEMMCAIQDREFYRFGNHEFLVWKDGSVTEDVGKRPKTKFTLTGRLDDIKATKVVRNANMEGNYMSHNLRPISILSKLLK